MEIITGYTGKKHVTSEQDRDINIGIVGGKSYVLCTGMQMEAEVSTNNEIKIRDGVVMHQGCAASVKKNTYDSVTIISGSQGMKRIDRIVARYQRSKDTNIESLDWVAIQGIPAENDPVVPEYVIGDIQAGDYVADMPMYQVVIDGLNIVEVKKEFETTIDIATMKKELAELNGKIDTLPASLAKWDVLGTYIDSGSKSCKPLSGNRTIAISLFDNANNASHGFNMVPLELFEKYNSIQHAFGISAYNNGRIFCYVNYVNNTTINVQVTPGYGVCVYGF